MSLISDTNGNKLQLLVPYENRSAVTTLNVDDEKIVAIALTEPSLVKINNADPAVRWPTAFYAMGDHIKTLDFSASSDIIVMK